MSVTLEQSQNKAIVRSHPPFETFLRNWAEHIREEQYKLRGLLELSVKIHKRARGLTISDQCGDWGTRPTTQGRWLDYDRDLDGDVHPINIVGDAILTNKNACLQSDSNTEVTAANQNARHKQIAMRWQRVSNYFERKTWDEAKRGYIFDSAQKCGTVLNYTFLDKRDQQSVADINQSKSALAAYSCENCAKVGLMHTEMPDGNDSPEPAEYPMPCPHCGNELQAKFHPVAGFDLSEQNVDTYDINTDVVPFYNFTIDTYGARIKGIQGAKWLQIQNLTDRMELEDRYPHFNFSGAEEWSYPVRCDYALANADWSYLNSWGRSRGTYEFDRFEVRDIYLHGDAYRNYTAPEDYQFINASGTKTFSITRGQSISEAWNAMHPGQDTDGLKFVWSDQRLLEICSPETEEINFRECFSDIHWARDSGSYLSSPFYSIVEIQDQITLINTMNMNIVGRNAVNPVFFDSTIFDKVDFQQEFIPTKNAALLPDADMRQKVLSLPVPTPSPYLSQQLTFLWEIKDSVTAVTPAMRGEEQKGAPYAAQRQQLEQSYGNLTGVLKSFAQCKNTTFVQQAKLCKKKWTLEQFQRIGSLWGDEWTEQDVKEMCDIDFDEDLVVSYRSGSEMPQSNLTKEMKFFAGLQQLMPMVQAFPQLIGTDKLTRILERIGDTMDFDFDITDLETNELIAQKRYNILAEICKQEAVIKIGKTPIRTRYNLIRSEEIDIMRSTVAVWQPVSNDVQQQAIQLAQSQPNDPATIQQAQAMMKPTPVTQLELLTERIFHESQIKFSQYEDLAGQQAFFIECLRSELGKLKPNFVLIEMLNVLLGMLEQATSQIQQQNLEKNPQYQIAMQQQQQAAQSDAQDKALQQQKVQTEQVKIAVQSAHQDADRQAAEDHKAADLIHSMATQAADHSHEASINPAPKENIVAQIKYESLPPAAQQELLKEIDVDVPLSDLKGIKDADAKAAQAKASASKKTTTKK